MQRKIFLRVSHLLCVVIWIQTSVLSSSGALASLPQQDTVLADQVKKELRSQVERGEFSCQGQELVCGVDVLPAFYVQHSYRPVWGLEQGNWDAARIMLDCIQESASQGMDPSQYHFRILNTLLARIKKQWPMPHPGDVSDADILLTDAFFTLAGHLRAGRVNPENLYPSWAAFGHAPDLIGALNRALTSGSLRQELKRQLPPHSRYHKLQEAYEHYEQIARLGGWPRVPAGENLEYGDRSERVLALSQRLAVSRDLPLGPWSTISPRFTERVETAVRRFQERHGLRVDGIVGPRTLAALNVSAEERAVQTALNLERWRWIPRDLGSPHVRVNVADFRLVFQDADGFEWEQRVIVGKTARRTPVFSDQITYLVLNPAWNVPRSIMIKDILPQVVKNPEYLEKNSMTLLSGWGEGAEEIDPQSITWQEVDISSFPYRLRQEPGPDNALGRIKFMFPNPFSVYLHDTPHKTLFERVSRDFSSGCIRLEQPLRLALDLLEPDPEWDLPALQEALASKETRIVRLSRPVPVHLLYWTAWVNDAGQVNFREDIYNRDRKLQVALARNSPASEEKIPSSPLGRK
jgi:murein L,D-transpeptidase YcbB/YkuD